MINTLIENIGLPGILSWTSQAISDVNKNDAPSGKIVKELDPQFEEEYMAFSEFIGKYGRSYATMNDHQSKFEIFQTNYREIKAHNQRHEAGEHSWTKVINQFSDMTSEEFNARYHSAKLTKPDTLTIKERKPHIVKASNLPEYVNWYEAGKVSESVD